MRRRYLWPFVTLLVTGVVAGLVLVLASYKNLMPLPDRLEPPLTLGAMMDRQVLARDGTPLNQSFGDDFNRTSIRSLSDIPLLLRHAFVMSEDNRFWEHGGVDWRARLHALWNNFRKGARQRGASTIAEQTARILHAHPRSYWGHWMTGLDANRLVSRFGRADILAFYLNQVPYAARRRGVVQGANYYFGRKPAALNSAEQLALAVLVRSPSRYDPRRHPDALRQAVNQLAERMAHKGIIDTKGLHGIKDAPIRPNQRALTVNAGSFVSHVRTYLMQHSPGTTRIRTTLDPALQNQAQALLQHRVAKLKDNRVRDGAALVVDNRTGDILAWATAPGDNPHGIDPITTPRQPGSALKPFVYAAAMLQLGWQPDHELEDSPFVEQIHSGIHNYRNYSGNYHGPVTLRYALGNSLNIPAVRTARRVGVNELLSFFKKLGFTTFTEDADHYGAAIAIGDGAVSLYEMVQAYATLARHGDFLPLDLRADAAPPSPVSVLPDSIASLMGNILSDKRARRAEFGASSILNLPYPTAAKTGTSSDYRDAWTLAYDDRYTVGVWMGRLDNGVIDGVTGSLGPAPVMRHLFAYLRQQDPYAGLWLSPELEKVDTCQQFGKPPCIQRSDWHHPIDAPATPEPPITAQLIRPVQGEELAIDPRVPRSSQRFEFQLRTNRGQVQRVVWMLDDEELTTTDDTKTDWVMSPGKHQLQAEVWLKDHSQPITTAPASFWVHGNDE